jgi:hypothetical protein
MTRHKATQGAGFGAPFGALSAPIRVAGIQAQPCDIDEHMARLCVNGDVFTTPRRAEAFEAAGGVSMPKDTSIKRILVIGSGPIVIGQGCEFDYSGVQACKALREEGYEVVLINSNPATIMTDPEFAFRTYIEPITPEIVEKIIIKEKPDVLLPTLGGQTALNTAMSLHRARGTLKNTACA